MKGSIAGFTILGPLGPWDDLIQYNWVKPPMIGDWKF